MPEEKAWWQRIRDRNRTLKGLISARRRHTARMERLQGRQPKRRQYSVPAIARRIGTTLPYLKRVIRGDEVPPAPLLARLAKDLDIPASELRSLFEGRRPAPAAVSGTDPFVALELSLIQSARQIVELLRGCVERGKGAPRRDDRRQRR